MNAILAQIARTTLLPDELAEQILAGTVPLMEDVVLALVIGAMDAEATTANDVRSTWNEKRLARLGLGVAFLLAIASINGPSQGTAVASQNEIPI